MNKEINWYEEVKQDFTKNISDSYTLNLAMSILEDRKNLLNDNLDLQNNWNELKEIEKEHQRINGELREKLKIKQEIIEEVRECMKENRTRYIYQDNLGEDWCFEDLDVYSELLQILDKGESNESTNPRN